MLNRQQILLFNNSAYIICLGHKSVTTSGYLLGRYQQLHPRQRVILCWYDTDSCFLVIGLDTCLNQWNHFPVRENEFKGFCQANSDTYRAGINMESVITPINGYAFSVANIATTTGTNWSISYSVPNVFLILNGDGDILAETELYKTRNFHVGYGVDTVTINNLALGNYYMFCVLQNNWDNGTIRTTRIENANTNTRTTFNYQQFRNLGGGYPYVPNLISYFIFRCLNSSTEVFTITNVSNSHLHAVFVIGLGATL
jgi:hypothetical protein